MDPFRTAPGRVGGMALVYRAEIRPTKLELLTPWVAGQAWCPGPERPELEKVGAYRFDDPAGEVGVETLLVRAGDGPVLQVPMTYRAAPLAGAERFLIGTMEHSVLGDRWIYDGCGDPVYATTLLATMLTGGGEAPEFVDYDGEARQRETTTNVRGSGGPATRADEPAGRGGEITAIPTVTDGDPTIITTEAGELAVVRILSDRPAGPAVVTLTGTWEGRKTPALLAYARELGA
jgi:hypothetical protein